jgi:NitT/TauT family transport system substrate-binding protein
MTITQTRRQFLTGLSLTSSVGLLGARPALAAEAALETTSVRITKNYGICYAPQYVAEEFLRGEGLTDVRYVDTPVTDIGAAIAQGKVDFGMNYALLFVRDIDAGASVTVIGGVMVGCTELFARKGINSVTDLKGKTLGVQATGSHPRCSWS